MQKRNIRCMKICEKKYIDRNRYLRAGRSKFNVETPKKKVLWNQILVYFKTFRQYLLKFNLFIMLRQSAVK